VVPVGGVDLAPPAREPMREPPSFVQGRGDRPRRQRRL